MAKHRIAYAASAAALALTGVAIPTNVLADDGETATVSSYDDLLEAFDRESVSRIVLGADIEDVVFKSEEGGAKAGDTGIFDVSRSITLDTNGKKLTDTTSTAVCKNSENKAMYCNLFNVTGEDTKFVITGNGTITSYGNTFNVTDAATYIKNGTITSERSVVAYANYDGSVYVEDGTLTSKAREVLGGNNTTGNMNFYVSGGTLYASKDASGKTEAPSIYMPGQTNLQITGGTLYGSVSVRMGQVIISDAAEIHSTEAGLDGPADVCPGNEKPYCLDYSGVVVYPGVVNVLAGAYTSKDGNDLNIQINGGKLVSENDNASYGGGVVVYDTDKVSQSVNIDITGGDFAVRGGQSAVKVYTRTGALGEGKTLNNVGNSFNVNVAGGKYNVAPDHLKDGYVWYKTTSGYGVAAESDFGLAGDGTLTLKPGERYDIRGELVGVPGDYAGGLSYVSSSPLLNEYGVIQVPDVVNEKEEFTATVSTNDGGASKVITRSVDVTVNAGMHLFTPNGTSAGGTKIDFAKVINNGNVSLKVGKLDIPEAVAEKEPDLKEIYDISVVDNENDEVVEVEDNDMTITVNYVVDKEYNNFQIAYVKDGKIAEYIDVESAEPVRGAAQTDNVMYAVTFKTDHLSGYGAIASDDEITDAATKNAALAATPDTGAMTSEGTASSLDTTALVATVVVMTLATAGMEIALWKKRQMRK